MKGKKDDMRHVSVLTVFWTFSRTRKAERIVSGKTVALDRVIVVGRGQEDGVLTNTTMQFTK